MIVSIFEGRISPDYAVLLAGDPDCLPPEEFGGSVVASSGCVLAIGTLAPDDGSTLVRLIAADHDEPLPEAPAFAGSVALPTKRFALSTVTGTDLFVVALDMDQVDVSVWVNDPSEPDEITIGLMGTAALTVLEGELGGPDQPSPPAQ